MPVQRADPVELGRRIVAMCREVGFAAAGVCAAEKSHRAREFRAWLGEGRHGEMNWLAETVDARLDPASELPGVRSVVMVADQYAARGSVAREEPGQGRIARYAQGRDYHQVIKRRLHRVCDRLLEEFPGERFRAFVDTAPIAERDHAVRAGLGWIGKHTLVIHPRLGSWLLLGGILTTLPVAPEPDAEEGEGGLVPDHCGTCTRCIDACPTGAIEPYRVDASRCISYLTIEHRSPIADRLMDRMGSWLFGCDVCQEVCPHNSARPEAPGASPLHASFRSGFELLKVLGWTRHQRSASLGPTALKRARLEMFKRNAIIASANAIKAGLGSRLGTRLRQKIEDLAWDAKETEMVRQTARDALARIRGR